MLNQSDLGTDAPKSKDLYPCMKSLWRHTREKTGWAWIREGSDAATNQGHRIFPGTTRSQREAQKDSPQELSELQAAASRIFWKRTNFCCRKSPACTLSDFSCVWFLVTWWTVAHHPPLCMEFSRQEHWSKSPCPPSGDLPNPGV